MIDYMLEKNTIKEKLRGILNVCLVFTFVFMFCLSQAINLESSITVNDKYLYSQHFTINQVVKDEHREHCYIVKTNDGDYEITSIVGKIVDETKLFSAVGGIYNFHIFRYKGKKSIVGIYPNHYAEHYDSTKAVLRVPDSFDAMREVVGTAKVVLEVLATFSLLSGFILILVEHALRKRIRYDLAELFADKVVAQKLSENQGKYRDSTLMSFYSIVLIALFGSLNLFALNASSIVIYSFLGLIGLALVVWGICAIVFYQIAKHKDVQLSINYYNDDLPNHKDEQGTDVVPTFSEHPITYAFCEKGVYSALEEYFAELRKDNEKLCSLMFKDMSPIDLIYLRAMNEASLVRYRSLLVALGYDNVSYTFDELNFYTKVVLYPYGQVFVFIESDIEIKNKRALVHNLIFQYDEVVSYWVKNYNIKVRGLDYFLEHRKEIITKNCKHKTKVLKFNGFGNDDENICDAPRNNCVEWKGNNTRQNK